MNLFESLDMPSKWIFHDGQHAPVVTAERFAAMPPHMRSEFARLAAERGLTPAQIHAATGIAAVDLFKARQEKHSFALSYNPDAVPESEASKIPHRLGWHHGKKSHA